METSAVARRAASRFVAGDTLADAMAAAHRIHGEGIALTLDHLGENVTSLAEAEASRDVCLRALDEIAQNRIDGNVSIKLTQFGMDISTDACYTNVEQLVSRAPNSATGSCGSTWSRVSTRNARSISSRICTRGTPP
jgi:proline dehydrogenase